MYRDAITPNRLRTVLEFDPATGIFTRLVATARRNKVGDIAGSLSCSGYLQIMVDRVMYLAHRLAWLHVHGEWPKNDIDHIDGNKVNNRISNLREACHWQNQGNRGPQVNNKSGFKGVYWHRRAGKWVAKIQMTGGSKHLGYFTTPEAAAARYARASSAYFGEFARLV